ncbi:MAG: rod shape-determining protein MreD [Ignavibacteriae bacterium]|nr:rod shape-determining protein MreD [Ignavibacteriota bacterium]
MRRIVSYTLLTVLLVALHSTLVNVISIGTAIPDVLLIWIVYISITSTQLNGTLAGFAIGLLVDLISGNDGMLGLSALTKAVAGFLAGYFYNENMTEQTLAGWKFVFAVGVVSLLHNAVYFLIFLQGTEISWWRIVALHGIPSALYTTTLATVPMFVFRRKYS